MCAAYRQGNACGESDTQLAQLRVLQATVEAVERAWQEDVLTSPCGGSRMGIVHAYNVSGVCAILPFHYYSCSYRLTCCAELTMRRYFKVVAVKQAHIG